MTGLNRKQFLHLLIAVFFPCSKIQPCSGEGPLFLKQTIAKTKLPVINQGLEEYLDATLGKGKWSFDSKHILNLLVADANVNGPEGVHILNIKSNLIQIEITLPEKNSVFEYLSLELIHERLLKILDPEFKSGIGMDEYVIRQRAAKWIFPSRVDKINSGETPEILSVTTGNIIHHEEGRYICIARLRNKKTRKEIIKAAVSKKIGLYCFDMRHLVPDYEYALKKCEDLRNDSWNPHITKDIIDGFVNTCRENIFYE